MDPGEDVMQLYSNYYVIHYNNRIPTPIINIPTLLV